MFKIIFLIPLIFLVSFQIQAQDSTQTTLSWFSFEGGIGVQPEYEDPGAGKFGFDIQIKRHLIRIHMAGVGGVFRSHSEMGLLYGRVLTPLDSKFMGALSTGISYVSNSQTQFGLFGGPSGSTSTFQGPGLPIQASFHYRILKFMAIGGTSFINLNRDQNFGGITIGIHLGKFRN